MPLSYSAKPAAPTPTAAAVPAGSSKAPATVASAPSTAPGENTRAALFNADGSPKPIRNLSALREQLAGTGGVNPPESKVPETSLEPRTVETEDGGAAPIQPLPDTPTVQESKAKRTRRTPAQMAEAKAALAGQTTPGPVAGSTVAPDAAESAKPSLGDLFTTDELIAELVRRVRVYL